MRRTLVILVVLAAVVVAVLYALRKPLALRVMERQLETNFAADRVAGLPDGLHVAICGAGSPLPDPARSGPCTAVIAGREVFVVDAGTNASRVLARMRIGQGRVEAVLLTHFHSDHIDGLGELLLQRWVGGGHTEPAPVIGPSGVEEVVEGFNRAYRQDAGYRVAHHGESVVPPSGFGGVARPFAPPADGERRVVWDEGGVKVTAFRVNHAPVDPAVGYRFDYAGRSVVVSGDTVRSSNLEAVARGADLLVHEALSPKLVGLLTRAAERAGNKRLAKITRDILTYHATPVDAARSARAAGVRHLVLNHVVPPLLLRPLEEVFLEGVAEAWPGPVTLARDGLLVEMPAGSTAIRTSVVRGF